VRTSFGLRLANSAIRRSFVETPSRHDVPFIFPSCGSVFPAPPFPPRGPSGRFPHFAGPIEELRLLLAPSRCASVVPRVAVLPPRARFFAPSESERSLGGLGSFHRGPLPGLGGRGVRPPRFLGHPCSRAVLSQTPVGPRCLAFSTPRCCQRSSGRRWPQHLVPFEALSHGSCARCLRFAAAVADGLAQDSLPAAG
jgi:hypothetical protein